MRYLHLILEFGAVRIVRLAKMNEVVAVEFRFLCELYLLYAVVMSDFVSSMPLPS